MAVPLFLCKNALFPTEFPAGFPLAASPEMLAAVGAKAKEHNIKMSFHTPYFISLSGVVPEKRLKSIEYIRQSLEAAKLLGAGTIVVHTGSAAKISRDEAMRLAADTLVRTISEVDTTIVNDFNLLHH